MKYLILFFVGLAVYSFVPNHDYYVSNTKLQINEDGKMYGAVLYEMDDVEKVLGISFENELFEETFFKLLKRDFVLTKDDKNIEFSISDLEYKNERLNFKLVFENTMSDGVLKIKNLMLLNDFQFQQNYLTVVTKGSKKTEISNSYKKEFDFKIEL